MNFKNWHYIAMSILCISMQVIW